MDTIETILLRASLYFLIIVSFAGLIIGAIFIFRPHWLKWTSLICNRWISTRTLDKILESTIKLDPWFHHYHRAVGAFILAGALYILYFFSVQINKDSAIASLINRFHLPPDYPTAIFEQMD